MNSGIVFSAIFDNKHDHGRTEGNFPGRLGGGGGGVSHAS